MVLPSCSDTDSIGSAHLMTNDERHAAPMPPSRSGLYAARPMSQDQVAGQRPMGNHSANPSWFYKQPPSHLQSPDSKLYPSADTIPSCGIPGVAATDHPTLQMRKDAMLASMYATSQMLIKQQMALRHLEQQAHGGPSRASPMGHEIPMPKAMAGPVPRVAMPWQVIAPRVEANIART